MACLVGHRNGVKPASDAYLSGAIKAGEPIGRSLDIERVMQAAGVVERVMGLGERIAFESARKAAER